MKARVGAESALQNFALRAMCLAAIDLARDEAERQATAAAHAFVEVDRREARLRKQAAEIERLTATLLALQGPAVSPPLSRRLEAIVTAVQCETGIAGEALTGRCRRRQPAGARMLAMYLAGELTPLSLPQIGRHFGRDHTTVLHACRAIEAATGEEAARRDRVMALLKAALADDSGGGENER